jgi:hypothetical protein
MLRIKLKLFLKRLTVKRRAFKLGQKIINNRIPTLWSRSENKNLIRLNRIVAGLKPFSWDKNTRWVRGVFECKVSLHSFGNIADKPVFGDAIRDLVMFSKGG